MPLDDRLPSALVITTTDRETLVKILDDLAPRFCEPGPRLLRQQDGVWQRMLLIPDPWCVHDYGPVAPEVQQAARVAFELGATEVRIVTHELSWRSVRRLTSVETR